MEQFFERAPLLFRSIMPFHPVAIGHLEVTPIPAHHRDDELCLNFLLSDGGRTALYACDTGWYDPQTWDFLATRRLDTVIMECGKGNSLSNYDGHLNVEEVVRVKCRLIDDGVISPDAPFYLTHIAHTGLLLHEEMVELVAPYGMTVAYDGMQVTV
jgi:phosphoribosyl 1,2-cyclic phosphate phosphodiesterase